MTECAIDVAEVLWGAPIEGAVSVTAPGGQLPDGSSVYPPNGPLLFANQEHVLVLGREQEQGSYPLLHAPIWRVSGEGLESGAPMVRFRRVEVGADSSVRTVEKVQLRLENGIMVRERAATAEAVSCDWHCAVDRIRVAVAVEAGPLPSTTRPAPTP